MGKASVSSYSLFSCWGALDLTLTTTRSFTLVGIAWFLLFVWIKKERENKSIPSSLALFVAGGDWRILEPLSRTAVQLLRVDAVPSYQQEEQPQPLCTSCAGVWGYRVCKIIDSVVSLLAHPHCCLSRQPKWVYDCWMTAPLIFMACSLLWEFAGTLHHGLDSLPLLVLKSQNQTPLGFTKPPTLLSLDSVGA